MTKEDKMFIKKLMTSRTNGAYASLKLVNRACSTYKFLVPVTSDGYTSSCSLRYFPDNNCPPYKIEVMIHDGDDMIETLEKIASEGHDIYDFMGHVIWTKYATRESLQIEMDLMDENNE